MREGLQSYLAHTMPRSALSIYYHIGDAFSGETELRLRGDGTYEAWSSVTQGRQRRTYSGVVEVSQVEQLVRKLLEVEIWNVTDVFDKPGEDDPQAVIAVEINSQRFETVLWVSEIRHCPPFEQAQQALLFFLRGVSSGEILEIGR